jgi:hypothetical protein
MILLLNFSSKCTLAQNLPTDNQTLADAKNAIKTASVVKAEFTGDWKMEKESGYTFANLAKRPVKMQVKDNSSGKERRFEGLAIYERGAPSDKWLFSRYFTYTNSIEEIGSAVSSEDLLQLTLANMAGDRPFDWFGEVTGVFTVFPVKIVPNSYKKRSEKNQYWEIEFELEQRWDYKYLVKRTYKKSVDIYQNDESEKWHFVIGSLGEKQLERKEMNPDQLDKMPNMQKVGFKKVYKGDWVSGNDSSMANEENTGKPSSQSEANPKPVIKKPVFKVKIGAN